MDTNTHTEGTEFRVTFPLKLGAFDIFHPPAREGQPSYISLLLDPAKPTPASGRLKTDVYILLPEAGKYNLKFGDKGKTYDLKVLSKDDPKDEGWLNVTKGSLAEDPANVKLLESKLRASLTAEQAGSPSAQALEAVIALLNSGAVFPHVTTTKHLTTLKLQSGVTIEQIDFTIDSSEPRQVLRSISLEGDIPKELMDSVIAATEAYGDARFFGGFPRLLATRAGAKPGCFVEVT